MSMSNIYISYIVSVYIFPFFYSQHKESAYVPHGILGRNPRSRGDSHEWLADKSHMELDPSCLCWMTLI